MNKKYIYATIKVPLEITDVDNKQSIEPLREYIKVDFENCDILPEKNIVDYSSIMDSLKELLHNSDETEMEIKISELFILPDEIKNSTSRRLNSSFKNKPKYVKNYSTKNYNFNE